MQQLPVLVGKVTTNLFGFSDINSSQLLHQSKTCGNKALGYTACGSTDSRYSRTTCKREVLYDSLAAFMSCLTSLLTSFLSESEQVKKEIFFLLRISLSSFLSLCVPAMAYHLIIWPQTLLQDRLMSLFHVWTIWAHRQSSSHWSFTNVLQPQA